MNPIFQENIDWDTLPGDRQAFRIEVDDMEIREEEQELKVHVRLNFVLSMEDRKRLTEALSKLGGNLLTRISYEFYDLVQSQEEATLLYLPWILEQAEEKGLMPVSSLAPDVRWEDGFLTILVCGQTAAEHLNKKMAIRVGSSIKQALGFPVTVRFQNNDEEYAKVRQEIEKNFSLEMEKDAEERRLAAEQAKKWKQENQAAAGSFTSDKPGGRARRRCRKEDAPAQGDVLLGQNRFDGALTALDKVGASSHQVIVEGTLFNKEAKTVKNGRKLLLLDITDNKTSLPLKAYISEEKWVELDELLKEGDDIKALGRGEISTFDGSFALMVNGIMRTKRKRRQDRHEGMKRVELHCHSKMSALDGLNEVETIVTKAASWGQTAVAITDHGVTQAFPDAAKCASALAKDSEHPVKIKIIYGLEGYLLDDDGLIREDGSIDYKSRKTNHIILLAASQEGVRNLYKLVSLSHLSYFYRTPRIPRSILTKYREGLLLGSACEAGEVYRAVENKVSDEELDRICSYYDYLEIQPLTNNKFLLEEGKAASEEELKDNNRRIVAAGERLHKPVVATTDAHFDEPESAIFRTILQAGQGYQLNGTESPSGLYMRTTDEMLEEFSYLGKEKAQEVVITNTNAIADLISDQIRPVPDVKCPPKIKGAEERLRTTCLERAHRLYGDPLPAEIAERLNTELSSIIRNGYAVMYVSAQMLVQKSMEDGYLVGSRGSVGSSFAATMAGITEVNPLAPHYICPTCRHLEWGDPNKYDCGIDMPDKLCPVCGTPMKRDGFSIPFATFLGFSGNKEPDIDLNFAGEYQQIAHKYVGQIFGEENVFKAGTVATVANKTATGFVLKYADTHKLSLSRCEVKRLAKGLAGTKRTTGQHPGGIIIVPADHEIYEFCPIQHPANDSTSDIITTHFDYHKIEKNLLKLDILGHNVPSMIRQLQDMTSVDPRKIDLADRKVLSIFNGIEALAIRDPEYKYSHGTYGIPEFGTSFVRQMLDDIRPERFADLVRIAGFSHGTDVWLNNAQDYIKSGQAKMSEVISTRDDIMNYLILKGVENKEAFTIMEDVRKNRPLKEEQIACMKACGVPDWYIDSCKKVQYLFPRAHAVAYVMMSFRMAWYKVYYPREFYATYFTQMRQNFDVETIMKGKSACLAAAENIAAMGDNASDKEKDRATVYEIVYEMYARGYSFRLPILGKSKALRFGLEDGKILLPFAALEGLGDTAATALETSWNKKAFATVEEAVNTAKLNKTAVESLKKYGVFDGLPETDQMSLFGMLG